MSLRDDINKVIHAVRAGDAVPAAMQDMAIHAMANLDAAERAPGRRGTFPDDYSLIHLLYNEKYVQLPARYRLAALTAIIDQLGPIKPEALWLAAGSGASPNEIDAMIASGADPDARDEQGKNALWHYLIGAGRRAHLRGLRALLKAGAGVDVPDTLALALKRRVKPALITCLLDACKDNDQFRALLADPDENKKARLLALAAAQIDKAPFDKMLSRLGQAAGPLVLTRALHLLLGYTTNDAVFWTEDDGPGWLIRAGADPTRLLKQPDTDGYRASALHLAATRKGCGIFIRGMLDAMPDNLSGRADVLDSDGVTPIDRVLDNPAGPGDPLGRRHAAHALIEAGARGSKATPGLLLENWRLVPSEYESASTNYARVFAALSKQSITTELWEAGLAAGQPDMALMVLSCAPSRQKDDPFYRKLLGSGTRDSVNYPGALTALKSSPLPALREPATFTLRETSHNLSAIQVLLLICGDQDDDERQGTELLRALIKAGAPLHSEDHLGDTALHLATRRGQPQWLQVLVAGGARVDARNRAGRRPIHQIFTSESTPPHECLLCLLGAGADPNRTGEDACAPLESAMAMLVKKRPTRGKVRLVKALLDAGAAPSGIRVQTARQALTNLFRVGVGSGDDIQVMNALLEVDGLLTAQAEDNDNDDERRPLLLSAAGQIDPGPRANGVKAMLERLPDLDVNQTDDQGWSALTVAVRMRDPDVTQTLIEAGANVRAADWTALADHYADKAYSSAAQRALILEHLCQADHDRTAASSGALGALIQAGAPQDAIRTLIESLPDVLNGPDETGLPVLARMTTGLNSARPALFRLVLEHGAPPDLPDTDGHPPLMRLAMVLAINAREHTYTQGAQIRPYDQVRLACMQALIDAGASVGPVRALLEETPMKGADGLLNWQTAGCDEENSHTRTVGP